MNEYTTQQQTDGSWSVLVNGAPMLSGLTKAQAMNSAADLYAAQVEESEDEA